MTYTDEQARERFGAAAGMPWVASMETAEAVGRALLDLEAKLKISEQCHEANDRAFAQAEARVKELEQELSDLDSTADIRVRRERDAARREVEALRAACEAVDAYNLANHGVPCRNPEECDTPDFCGVWAGVRAALRLAAAPGEGKP